MGEDTMMTRKQKMLVVMRRIAANPTFEDCAHRTAQFGEEFVRYYHDGDDYFDLSYEGIKVNVRGVVETGDIERHVNLDAWLDKLLLITMEDTLTLKGKKYKLVEVGGKVEDQSTVGK